VAGRSVDRHVERLLEGWSLLYEVIAEEPKMTALREDTGLIIYRPILEVEYLVRAFQ
jgi:hypothetical protein